MLVGRRSLGCWRQSCGTGRDWREGCQDSVAGERRNRGTALDSTGVLMPAQLI